MPHPLILTLRERRSGRDGQGVIWDELDPIIDLLEDLMEGITQTEAALAQLKSDSEARDAATTAALGDLKAEVAKLEAQGIDTTGINATINALDAAVKTGTTEAQAADPGAQTPQPTLENVSVSIGENGEGSTTVSQPSAQVSVSGQPQSGTASVLPVEGQPGQTVVKVVNSTPSTTQTVAISIAPAA